MRSLPSAAPPFACRSCDSTVVRAHVSAAGAIDRAEAPLATAGRLSTKIHLKTDLRGLPLAFELTEGQASDSPMFEVLLDLGPDIKPRAAVGDKGYANRKNRAAARDRPRDPVQGKGEEPASVLCEGALSGPRRIEQLVGKLKRFEQIALRCEKTARNFGSFVALVLGLILVKSVHTT